MKNKIVTCPACGNQLGVNAVHRCGVIKKNSTIKLDRMENGDYWSQSSNDGSAVIYTGEDAQILDVIFKYAGKK